MIALDLQFGRRRISSILRNCSSPRTRPFQYKYKVKGISADLVRNWRVQLPKIRVRGVTAESLDKSSSFPKISKGPVPGRYANSNVRKTKAKHSNHLRYQLNRMSQTTLILCKRFHKKKPLSSKANHRSKPSQKRNQPPAGITNFFQQLPRSDQF